MFASERWRVLLLLTMTVWLGVIVPGHQRGAITLPGSGDDCCPTPATPISAQSCHIRLASRSAHAPSRRHEPTQRDKAQCAVCHFAIRLDVPLPMDFSPYFLELTRWAQRARAPACPLLQRQIALLSRGPPADLSIA